MSIANKRRDGFQGEKLISIPEKVWKNAVAHDPELFKIYISHIGYFPKAAYHYRERRKGCSDNIFFYCLYGKGHCTLDNKKYIVKPNQFMIIPATEKSLRYWADEADPWTIYWIHFTGEAINNLNASLNIDLHTGPVNIPFNNKGLEIWETIYHNLEMGYSKENLSNACMCLYYFLVTFLYPDKHLQKGDEEPVGLVTKTILYMRLNLHNKVTVEDMCLLHQLSASHFSNLFKKSTGMSPIDYFTHLKIQKACQLLNADRAKIKAVAQQLGYDDPYYFSRVFKKFMGVSPELYKVNLRK